MVAPAVPVTLVCRGKVEALDGEALGLRIGLTLWPLVLPALQQPRPAIGQHIQVLAIPQGGRSPRVSLDQPPTVAGWTKAREPKETQPQGGEKGGE